jgi:hypothetical protein
LYKNYNFFTFVHLLGVPRVGLCDNDCVLPLLRVTGARGQ